MSLVKKMNQKWR